jgi:ABC-2 type transport system permease protein
MQHLWLTAWTDILESLRAKWFAVYTLVFGSLVVLLFVLGLTESRVMGFTGLSRLMLTYIQLSMAILPIFVLITTVRSLAGDREAGVFEYLLALPVPLGAWYWGKLAGRFLMVFTPVLLAMIGALIWGGLLGAEIPWKLFAYYTGLLVALSWCFLGIGILISSIARSVDVAQGAAFIVWLVLLLFLDLILLGVMIQQQVPAETAVAIALVNPMQVFRTGTMLLFDPQLVMLGPAAYVILDNFGTLGYMLFALAYPTLLGTLAAWLGFVLFRRGDLL